MSRTFLVLAVIAPLFLPCSAHAQAGVAPSDTLTPGKVRADLTDKEIRDTTWGTDRRAVTPAMKREVFKRYHISGDTDPSCGTPRCEVDHRVPRSCGGADDVDNLWPQASPSWHEKDVFEDWAAKQVKSGNMSAAQCQSLFLAPADWRDGYQRIFGHAPKP